MTNGDKVSEMVRQAWEQQQAGNTNEAVKQFEQILKNHPTDIDAYYGLGLALRKQENLEAARAAFNNALNIISESIQQQAASKTAQDDHDNVKTPEDDRLQMLERMVRQRLSEVTTA